MVIPLRQAHVPVAPLNVAYSVVGIGLFGQHGTITPAPELDDETLLLLLAGDSKQYHCFACGLDGCCDCSDDAALVVLATVLLLDDDETAALAVGDAALVTLVTLCSDVTLLTPGDDETVTDDATDDETLIADTSDDVTDVGDTETLLDELLDDDGSAETTDDATLAALTLLLDGDEDGILTELLDSLPLDELLDESEDGTDEDELLDADTTDELLDEDDPGRPQHSMPTKYTGSPPLLPTSRVL